MDIKELQEIYQREDTIAQTARIYCEKHDIEYSDSVRRRVSRLLNGVKENVNDLENETETDTNQYNNVTSTPGSLMPSAWSSELNRFYTIEEFCNVYGLDIKTVKSSKLISHNSSHITYNIAFFNPEEEVVSNIEERLDEIVQKYIKPVEQTSYPKGTITSVVTNLTYTDAHVGLEPNKEGNSLYGGIWNKDELMFRMEEMVSETVNKSISENSNLLSIRDLGDLADGYNAQTTRGGHTLPQNMSNTEVFDAALDFKVSMVDMLVATGQYSEINCENVCNSNHGGDFDYFINSAFKQIVETKYENIKVNNHRKFISHYGKGRHCFIITHGKDMADIKFSMKPVLDTKNIEKIDHYIKSNNLYQQYDYFHLCKGDSHMFLLDFSTAQDFDYFNYPALSPSSSWVQNNFKRGLSGFVIETFDLHKEEIDFKYKKFEWKN